MYSTRTPPNARNARRRASEVAIGNQVHTIHRATEAPLAGANEIEARLKGQTFERSADQRSRRQPACRARARPTITRFRIMARSNSAKTPIIRALADADRGQFSWHEAL